MVKFVEEMEKPECNKRPCRRYNFSQNGTRGHVILSSINNNQPEARTANVSPPPQNYTTEVWGSTYQSRSAFVDMHLV